MLMVCHHLDSSIPEDIAFAESRIRAETIAAEDILHDIGAISMISSDSQAMGRVGEVITRTWQTADKMKQQFGALEEDSSESDNFRVKRYGKCDEWNRQHCLISLTLIVPCFQLPSTLSILPLRTGCQNTLGPSRLESWPICVCGSQECLAQNLR